MAIQVVILAAGQGKRMLSDLPKVLHLLGGKPILQRVLETALSVTTDRKPIVIIGHQGDVIQDRFAHHPVQFIEQKTQQGTGHAVLMALPSISQDDQVLILSGDVPLLTIETLQRLVNGTKTNQVGMITAVLDNATGYGRIIRNEQQHVISIVEEKDATETQRQIKEINTGIYLVPASALQKWLPTLNNKNAQGEYYLTDIIACAAQDKMSVVAVQPSFNEEVSGVNDRVQLAALERAHQRRIAEHLMRQGVMLLDPSRFDVRGTLQVGRDVVIDVNVIIEGDVSMGNRCVIGPNCLLRNVNLADGVEVHANSVIDGADVEAGCIIGPFARIRPGTVLAEKVHIGNFVEVKNSIVREASKINHLSYIGDSDIGKRVNVGAGTITCNYDGANKHRTQIGDDVHIGSGTQLVAPVSIGHGATLGAGSTLTKNAPADQLTVTHRLDQRTISSWQRPKKGEKLESI